MHVVSWNIELGRNLEDAAAQFLSSPDLSCADIVLLQEMSPEGTAEIAASLAMDHRYDAVAQHPETGQPFGNAVLSRWEMSPTESIALPGVARVQGQARSATFTRVSVGGRTVTACSVHLETVLLRLAQRRAQLAHLAEHISQAIAGPLVVGGDFNSASSRSLAVFDRELAGANCARVTSSSAATFHRFGRTFALDHIYARGLEVTASGVAREPSASDHQPVWSRFGWQPSSMGLTT